MITITVDLVRFFIAAILVVSLVADVSGQSQDCLDAVGGDVAGYFPWMSPTDVKITADPTGVGALGGWDADNDGILDWAKAKYNGVATVNGVDAHQISFFPNGVIADLRSFKKNPVEGGPPINKWPELAGSGKMSQAAMDACSPYFQAYLFFILSHEHLHAACGEHTGNGPDCPGLSIAVGTAGSVCSEACQAETAIEDCESDPDNCTGTASSVSPNLMSKQDLEEYLEGLCDSYSDIQNRWNNGQRQTDALSCFCDGNYDPPPNCPPIPALPGGADCDNPPSSGDAWPIPDCVCDSGSGPCP